MNYKVAISGKSGRMGKELCALLEKPLSLHGTQLELTEDKAIDVCIDFSHPTATEKLLETASFPLVIGTTGFNEAQLKKISEYAKKQPVLLAPNMSPGVNVLQKVLKSLKELKELGFEVVLSESHHKHKKDAPSGTAKSLISTLNEIGYKDFPVNVTRAGAERGLHTVTFYSEEEEFSLEHRVVDRRVFARGALLGAAYLLKVRTPGLYSYSDVKFS